MASDDFDAISKSFLEWCNLIGIRISPKVALMDLRAEGRGRGIVVTDNLKEGETVFSIPHDAILNSLTVVMMSLMLQNSSKWSPYFAVLPSKLESLIFWSPAELAELQASAVVQKIGKSDAEDSYRQKVEPLGMNGATMEFFHQMASAIMAYAFDIPEGDPESISETNDGEDLVPDDDNQRTVPTMIPLADMLNCDADQNNAHLTYDNDDLVMRTVKPILKGEEVLNDYGPLPRSNLLRRYGYITDNYSPYDVVEISTDSVISALQKGVFREWEHESLETLNSADLEARLELARREDVYEDSYDISHATQEEPCLSDDLVALIYFLLIDCSTLSSILHSGSTLPGRSKMATSFLGTVVKKLLERREQEYPTSLEEDDAILLVGNISHRHTLAVKVRQGEKIILREAMAEAASFRSHSQNMRCIVVKHGSSTDAAKSAKRMKFSRC